MSRFALVEHEALIALDIARTLEAGGYGSVEVFANGADYLSAFQARAFDLALIDLDSRGSISGLETAIASKSGGGPGIILIDSLLDKDILQSAQKAEPLGILSKPFSRRELVGVLEIGLYRAQMESRLSRSEKRYRNLFDLSLSPRCIAEHEGTTGPIFESNTTFDRLFDAREGLAGLFTDETRWKEILSRLDAGETVSGRELSMKGKDGASLQIIGSFSEVAQNEGKERLISAEFFDITESRKLRDELQQAQKMEAMGRLSGGIAHDFNNILTAIKGHATLLAMETDKASEGYQDIEGILKTTEKASNLSRQLLGFSRKQAYSPRSIDLASLIRDNGSLLRKLAGEGITFSTSVPEGECPIVADPVQIEQVLVNLVVNARDAVENKSDPFIRIVLGVESVQAGRRVRGKSLTGGTYYLIEVVDNGCGMIDTVANKIFEPFFTTKAQGRGTGFGLATVLDIAEKLGGAVEVETSPGRGADFRFWIPAGGPPVAIDGSMPAMACGETLPVGKFQLESGTALLVVDGDESVLAFVAYALSRAGAEVTPARNAGEALIFSERKRFKAMVIDLSLPGIDGLELHSRLGSSGIRLPCVFTTGKGRPSGFTEPEGTILLEKPYSPANLVAALTAVLSSQPRTAR